MAKTYRGDVDGLRAMAVAMVVAFHTFPDAMPGGFVGVDVFFVISGYLITGLILDEQATGGFTIKHFYVRRMRRILPALAVVIAATLVIGWFVLLPVPYERLGLHGTAGALFFQSRLLERSWLFRRCRQGKASFAPVVARNQEQFYLIWPLLLVALRRWRLTQCRSLRHS